MALVKKSKVNNGRTRATQAADAAPATAEPRAARAKVSDTELRKRAAERISVATTELAAGINQTAVAAEELQRSVGQITTGAEEAAGAAQESLRAITELSRGLNLTQESAQASQQIVLNLQSSVRMVVGTINEAIENVELSSRRQLESVDEVNELGKQVADISNIVTLVARIADQTNLLALNAAIEAARAGQNGKGFGVVADEVRSLAASAEKNAHDIQELVERITSEVGLITQGIQTAAETGKAQADKGGTLGQQLQKVQQGMHQMVEAGQLITDMTQESSKAAGEMQQGAEAIAAASEEQAAACEQSNRMITEQGVALTQSSQAAEELSRIAEELNEGANLERDIEEVAAIAEELSAAIEEINRAAMEVKVALGQISKGAQQQSAAAEESSAASAQIENGTNKASNMARQAIEDSNVMVQMLRGSRSGLGEMHGGIYTVVSQTRQSLEHVKSLETLFQRINKIVSAIANITIQTNMLAVSGAIEATRSGEFGKGFAVVSTDIRNLAQDSASHVDRIEDLVAFLQDQILSVRSILAQIADASASEADKIQRILENFETVDTEMGRVQTHFQEIATHSASMLQMSGEIKHGTEQVAVVANEAERATEQASTAADQQSRGTEELAAAIEEIAALADSLR